MTFSLPFPSSLLKLSITEQTHGTLESIYFIYIYIYGLLTKREAKYWPRTFFASINTQKKNEASIQPSFPNKLGQ